MGLIGAEDYYRMTGQYPAGYTPTEIGGSGSGGSGSSAGGLGSSGAQMSEDEFKRLMQGVGTARTEEEMAATIQRLRNSGVLDKLSDDQKATLNKVANAKGGNGQNRTQYGPGIPAQQFYSIESAISNSGSPEAAMQQFNRITDGTFANMSREQIDRLSAAMRKAGA
jgi:hypothetical protein